MQLTDLQSIVTLITSQEERIINQIRATESRSEARDREIHQDVILTKDQVTQINGRLRLVEVKTKGIETTCELRKEYIDDKMDENVQVVKLTKFLNLVFRNPKTSLLITSLVILGSETLVLLAIQYQWIEQIIKYFTIKL